MAVIRQYDNPVTGLAPDTEAQNIITRGGAKIRADFREGGQLLDQGARAAGAQTEELGRQVDDAQTLHEVAAGAATAATMHANWQDQWNAFLKANPDDPQAAQKFREQTIQPQLQQFADAFNTKRSKEWAIGHATQLSEHMDTNMAADQVNMAKTQLSNHLQQWQLAAGQAVVNDVHSLSLYQQEAPKIVEQMVNADSRLKAEDAEKAKGELTTHVLGNLESAAFHSLALKNPSAAEQLLKSGQLTHIDPDKEAQFLNQAYRNQRVDGELARAAADRAERKLHEKTAQDLFVQTMDAMKSGDPSAVRGMADKITEAVGSGHLSAEQGKSMFSYSESLTHKMEMGDTLRVSPEVNGSTIAEFRQRANLDDNDPNHLTMGDLFKAESDGKITLTQADFFAKGLREEAADPATKVAMRKFNASLNAIKPLIEKTLTTGMPDGVGKYYADMLYPQLYDEFIERVHKGEDVSKILNPDDPNSIYRNLKYLHMDPATQLQLRTQQLTGAAGVVIPPSLAAVTAKAKQDEADKATRATKDRADQFLRDQIEKNKPFLERQPTVPQM